MMRAEGNYFFLATFLTAVFAATFFAGAFLVTFVVHFLDEQQAIAMIFSPCLN
ncbi:MAG: hypothetical protein HQL17_03710 [Candidatus Omnitrophica bacterium]|nr:hypothetical protein [Candidatus Omnitrophota bacterium]